MARKQELIAEAGACCSICGYSNNLAALVFHHTQPGGKDFKLDMRSLPNRTYHSVRAEIEKCVLLCAKCHAEIHNPHLDR